MTSNNSITTWLFKPFKFIAGSKALIIGIVLMSLISVLGYFSNTHFDGVLDIHYGCPEIPSPYINHALYQLIGWGTLTIVFYITARIVTKSDIRFIDIAGTLALAQAPLILAAVSGFIPSVHICLGDLNTTSLAEMASVLKENILMLSISGLVMTVIVIWSILLKYNAYSVSANVKGAIGIVSFIIALVISEIISKVLLYLILPLF